MFIDLYEILEVSPNASKEVIQNTYKILARKYHPDLQPRESNKNHFEEKMKMLNMAYEVLSDESKRLKYDSEFKSNFSDNKNESRNNNSRNKEPEKKANPQWDSETAFNWLQQIIAENKSNHVFDVRIRSNRISIPQLCTCCLGNPDEHLKKHISYSCTDNEGFRKIRRTVSAQFPICSECAEHQNNFSSKRINIILKSIIPTLLMYAIGIFMGYKEMIYAFTLFSLPIDLLLLNILNKKSRLNKLNDHHADRKESVSIAAIFEGFVIFRFYNLGYAQLFARANNSSVSTNDAAKYNRGITILKGRASKQVISIILILFAGINAVAYMHSNPQILSDENKTVATSQQSNLQPATVPSNGSFVKYFSGEGVAPLKITTKGTNVKYYFIKIVDWDSRNSVMTIFVHAGSSAEVELPLGTYELKYAAGDTWYGEPDYFGLQTAYSKADKKFEFYKSGDYVNGYSVELFLQTNGNLNTSSIKKSEF